MNNIAMLDVRCISERKTNPGQITVGEAYVIDRCTIWIDRDGDAYGTVYDKSGKRVGELLLSHFACM